MTATSPPRTGAPTGAVITEVVTVRDFGPGQSGALDVPAGPRRKVVGVLALHDAPGNFHTDRTRGLSTAFATAGHVTLSPNLFRYDHWMWMARLEVSLGDIRGALDRLASEGIDRVVIVADGYSAHEVTHFLGTQGDARVAGLVVLDATESGGADARAAFTENTSGYDTEDASGYDKVVAEAGRLVGDGAAGDFVRVPAALAPGGVMTATSFLSYYGPDSPAKAQSWLPELELPVLELNDVSSAEAAAAVLDWLATQGLDDEDDAPASDTAGRVRHKLVTLTTADGARLPGVVHAPPPGTTTRPAGVVLNHGHVGYFHQGVSGFLGPALAAAGYTCIAFTRRGFSDHFVDWAFEEGVTDMAAAVEALADRGVDRVYLHGQSLGSSFAADYALHAGDERVAGLILTGAFEGAPVLSRESMDDEAWAAFHAEARAAVAGGDPAHVMFVPFHGRTGVCSARNFLTYLGEDSRAMLVESIASIEAPVLIIHGSNDAIAHRGHAEAVARAATKARSVSLVELNDAEPKEGIAGHGLRGIEPEAIRAVVGWLDAQERPAG